MRATTFDLDQAVTRGIITADQRDMILALGATARDDSPPEVANRDSSAERAPAIVVAYSAGAAAVLLAFGWFLIERWERLGAAGVLAVALVYATMFAVTSRWLARERFPLAAAFAALLAVGMTPIVTWALLSLTGLWRGPVHGHLTGRFAVNEWTLPARWAVIELATALTALLVYRVRPFAPLMLPVAIAAWLAPLHVAGTLYPREISEAMFGWGSLVMASLLVAAAHALERREYRNNRPGDSAARNLAFDPAGWIYRVAIAAYLVGIASLFNDSAVVRHGLAVLAVLGAFLALRLGRRELLGAAAIAFIGYLGYLAFDVFERVVSFPVVLATFGIGLILLTVAAQRRWPELARRLAEGRSGEPRLPGGYAIPVVLAIVALAMMIVEPPRAVERFDRRHAETLRQMREARLQHRADSMAGRGRLPGGVRAVPR